MGQILIRGLAEETMEALKARARRHGRSQEQEARMLIEEAAREERAWTGFLEYSERMLERLRRRGAVRGDAARDVRRDRRR